MSKPIAIRIFGYEMNIVEIDFDDDSTQRYVAKLDEVDGCQFVKTFNIKAIEDQSA